MVLRVYIENQVGRDPAYLTTADMLAAALAALAASAAAQLPGAGGIGDVACTVHTSDRPDLQALNEAEVFVGSGFDVNRLRFLPRLRLVHCTSAGVDRYLPLDWLPPGAVFTNSSGIHAAKAAEYATLALLMLNIRMPQFMQAQRQRTWAPRLTGAIAGKHLLVVGLGQLGAAVARAGRSLGLTVEALTRHGRPDPEVEDLRPIAALSERLPHADFVVLCCPLTDETRGLIDAAALARMRGGAGLINMARGPVVVQADLLAALHRSHLAGAVLDVFDAEPLPPDSPVWDAPGLVVTPHVSCDIPTGYTARSLDILARNLVRLRSGQAGFENQVSAALGY